MEESAPELLVEDEGRVRIFTINRPERANALSLAVRTRLLDEITGADEDPDVRAIVLTGAGDRSFCAGRDIKEMAEGDRGGRTLQVPMRGPTRTIYEAVLECRTPTIAALNGHAVGGGLELALACDLRIASDAAKLGMPEAKRGMGANFASVVLPRLVPYGIAMQMLFTGELCTAAEAARWGLVNQVVPPTEVRLTAIALAAQIAANAPLSLRYMKDLASRGASLPIQAALRLDFGLNPYLSEDRKEGARAFVEHRAPEWKGR